MYHKLQLAAKSLDQLDYLWLFGQNLWKTLIRPVDKLWKSTRLLPSWA